MHGKSSCISKYYFNDNNYKITIESFIIKTNHSKQNENHIFIINQNILEDIKTNNINVSKLDNICYARAYFIYLINNNPYLQINKIENDFIKKYNIKEFNSPNNDKIKIPINKVIKSAKLLLKRNNELNNFHINL